MYKHVIFDIDGTLIDTYSCTWLSIQMLANEYGISLSEKDFAQLYPLPSERVLHKLGFENNWSSVNDRWTECYNLFSDTQKIFSGIDDMLKELSSKHYVLSIVTSRLYSEVSNDERLTGILHYFSDIITAEMTLCKKPHPDPLLMCVRRSGIPKKDTVYVADTPADYACASSAGVCFALAKWGSRGSCPENLMAIEQPLDLVALLDQEASPTSH